MRLIKYLYLITIASSFSISHCMISPVNHSSFDAENARLMLTATGAFSMGLSGLSMFAHGALGELPPGTSRKKRMLAGMALMGLGYFALSNYQTSGHLQKKCSY